MQQASPSSISSGALQIYSPASTWQCRLGKILQSVSLVEQRQYSNDVALPIVFPEIPDPEALLVLLKTVMLAFVVSRKPFNIHTTLEDHDHAP